MSELCDVNSPPSNQFSSPSSDSDELAIDMNDNAKRDGRSEDGNQREERDEAAAADTTPLSEDSGAMNVAGGDDSVEQQASDVDDLEGDRQHDRTPDIIGEQQGDKHCSADVLADSNECTSNVSSDEQQDSATDKLKCSVESTEDVVGRDSEGKMETAELGEDKMANAELQKTSEWKADGERGECDDEILPPPPPTPELSPAQQQHSQGEMCPEQPAVMDGEPAATSNVVESGSRDDVTTGADVEKLSGDLEAKCTTSDDEKQMEEVRDESSTQPETASRHDLQLQGPVCANDDHGPVFDTMTAVASDNTLLSTTASSPPSSQPTPVAEEPRTPPSQVQVTTNADKVDGDEGPMCGGCCDTDRRSTPTAVQSRPADSSSPGSVRGSPGRCCAS